MADEAAENPPSLFFLEEYNQGMKVRYPLTCLLALGVLACAHPRPQGAESPSLVVLPSQASLPSTPSPIAAHPVDFATEIQPILESHCQPCHFPGGKMYERLPFDRGETIVGLGEKLFTRIKDEREQGIIREFLAQEEAGFSR